MKKKIELNIGLDTTDTDKRGGLGEAIAFGLVMSGESVDNGSFVVTIERLGPFGSRGRKRLVARG